MTNCVRPTVAGTLSGGVSRLAQVSQVVWVVLVVLCGCASKRVGAPAEKPPHTTPQQYAAKVRDVQQLAADGELDAALQRIAEVLGEWPPDPFRQQLRALRRDLMEARFYSLHPLHLSVALDRDRYFFGGEAGIELRIANLGAERLSLPSRHRSWWDALLLRDPERSVMWLEVDERDVDGLGATWSQRRVIEVPIEEDMVIGPGGSVTVRHAIPIGGAGRAGYRQLRVTALFRPIAIVGASGDRRYDPLEFPLACADVIRDRDARWFDGGLALLEVCVEGSAPGESERLFAAAMGVSDRDLHAGIDLVARAAPSLDPERRRAGLAALEALTGVEASRDPVRFLDWWETKGAFLDPDQLAARAGRRDSAHADALRTGALSIELDR